VLADVVQAVDRVSQIGFDDGHDSGLFSWDYLHKLGAEEPRIWAEYLDAAKRLAAPATHP